MKKYFVLLISVALIFISCTKTVTINGVEYRGRFQRVLKGTDMEKKYAFAERYYNKKDYYRALQLLEELISVYKGTPKGEQTYYYYTYSNYHTGDYAMAAYHFNNFVQTYPNSKYAEEMQFMHAYCYYLDSPIPSLDQTNTLDAIEKFQLFINKFPNSNRIEESNRLIDELRFKIETKAFVNAKLYYKTENYKAAVAAFENVLKDFPSTTFREEALFLSLKSSYVYARKSVESKQTERYKAAQENYLKLIDAYPQSKFLHDAEKIYTGTQAALKEKQGKDTVSVNP